MKLSSLFCSIFLIATILSTSLVVGMESNFPIKKDEKIAIIDIEIFSTSSQKSERAGRYLLKLASDEGQLAPFEGALIDGVNPNAKVGKSPNVCSLVVGLLAVGKLEQVRLLIKYGAIIDTRTIYDANLLLVTRKIALDNNNKQQLLLVDTLLSDSPIFPYIVHLIKT